MRTLLETPSPSGFEQPAQQVVRRQIEAVAETVETDVHGNVIAGVNVKGRPRVMLAGHCDQIGLMVKYIDENGFLFFVPIGGLDATVLPGSRVRVLSAAGPVEGVIGRKPIHLMKQEERNQGKVEMRDLWIDIGAKSRKDAEKRVAVGDPATFVLSMTALANGLVTAPAFDNKCGVFVVMEALRLARRKPLKCALFAVSTVQEEVGLRGARTSCYGLDPQVGIAVDVTHGTDYPDIDKRKYGQIELGKGPVIASGSNINPQVKKLLLSTARTRKIAHQIEAEPGGTGTDANAIQISRAGVAAGLVSVPNRYMHTQVEMINLVDLERAARLLAETAAKIEPRMSFIPR